MATAAEALPEVWDPESPAIRWRTTIPGEGISSPIVSGDRVFVTTAYRGSGAERDRGVVLGATLAVALLFLILAWRGRRRRRARDSPGDPAALQPRRMDRWDRRIVLSASVGGVALAVALAVYPDLLHTLGRPGRAWRLGSAIALLGLAATFGWFERRSWWRPFGFAVVLMAAVLLIRLGPSGHVGPASLSKWLPFIFLGMATVSWYLLAFWWKRGENGPPPGRVAFQPLIPLSLLAISILAFVPPIHLDRLQRVVVCLDLESGEILWETTVFSGPAEQKWQNSTYATPTPVTDGKHVFAYFGHGVAGVDFDGHVAWRKLFPGYFRSTRYGAGSSPIVADDAVILVRESEENQQGPPSWIAAIDKESGDTLWRVEPPGAHDSYTTPMAHRSGSRTQVLTASWNSLVAYDLGSGERLWSLDYPMEQMVASMARAGGRLAVTGGVYGEKTLMVVDLDESSGAGAEILWQTHRGVADIASPLFYDGMLFTLTTPGIMICYDAETGRELWKKRLDGEHYASLVAGDGKVYATSIEGSTTVLAAEPELRVIAENDLDARVYASPAIAHGSLLIRTADSLFRIDRSDDPAAR